MLVTSKSFGETREGSQFLMKSAPPPPQSSGHLHGFLVNISRNFENQMLPYRKCFFPCCASFVAGCQEILIRHPAVLLRPAFVTVENHFFTSASSVFFSVKYV